ncbi:Replication factor A protein 1 [Phlyctochytrium planicorne]|nr:Replication factor A protein 1 [Phlyctochytrium planicorne]
MTISENSLSKGFLAQVAGGADANSIPPNPVVQVLSIKKFGDGTQQDRYRFVLSDGVHFTQAMLATQMNSKMDAEEIVKNSVIQLANYIVNDVNDRRIIIILDLVCLNPGDKSCVRFGSPQDVQNAKPGDAPPAVQTNASSSTSRGGNDHANQNSGHQNQAVSNPYQRSAVEPQVAVFPVSSLNPYQNRWTIRARVVSKSDIREFTNARGAGKLFSVTFADESGEIRATGFNETVNSLYEVLVEGGVYYVSKASIKVANRKYGGSNQYEMTLETSTEIRPCEDRNLAPKIPINRVMLNALYDHEKDTNVDVLGVVHEVHDLQSLVSKTTQKPLQKRDLMLVDESRFIVRVTLWGRQAESFSATDNPVMMLKGARVSDFGGRCLSYGGGSSMHLNPETEEAFMLRGWYDSEGRSGDFQAYSQGGSGMSIGGDGMRVDATKTISQIADESLGLGEKPDYFNVTGTICYVRDSSMWYPACNSADCNKKVIETERGWRCEKCDKTMDAPNYRYVASMCMADHTGQDWFQLFNEQAEALFSKSANEMNNLKEENESKFKEVVKAAIWNQVTVKVRAKAENYNNEQKVRLTVMSINPIDWSGGSEQMINAIATYGV